MGQISQEIFDGLSPITKWAIDERARLLTNQRVFMPNGIKKLTLVVDLIGMSRIGKSRLREDLGSWYYPSSGTYGLQVGELGEPHKRIVDISEKDEKEFYKAECGLVFNELDEVVAPTSEKDLFIFDRGPNDLYIRTTTLQQAGIFSEEKCRTEHASISSRTMGKVDILFVFSDDIFVCIKNKAYEGSIDFLATLRLKPEDDQEMYFMLKGLQTVYRNCFLGLREEPQINAEGRKYNVKEQKPNAKFASSVAKYCVDIDVRKLSGENDEERYTQIFQRAVIVIDLYLVFKAWETIFRSKFAVRLDNLPKDKKGKEDLEKEIRELADILTLPFRRLKVATIGSTSRGHQVIEGSDEWEILQLLENTKFVVGQHGNVKVTMQKIFNPNPIYDVDGLK